MARFVNLSLTLSGVRKRGIEIGTADYPDLGLRLLRPCRPGLEFFLVEEDTRDDSPTSDQPSS